jgi:hypothetical protein
MRIMIRIAAEGGTGVARRPTGVQPQSSASLALLLFCALLMTALAWNGGRATRLGQGPVEGAASVLSGRRMRY